MKHLKKKSEIPRDFGSQNSAQTLQTMQHPSGSVGCTPEHAEHPPPKDASACGWGMKDTRCTPFRQTTRRPSACGWPLRVRSGHPPHEDHASNLVGPVRDIIGRLGGRRLFQAVRHIGRKWAARTPGMLQRVSLSPRTRGARSARTSSPQRARAARASEGV